MKGLVHIYCGDGKGKTSAAIGAAVRAAGRGKRSLIARFLKNDDSGEVIALKTVPAITLLPNDQNFGFSWNMSQKTKQAAAVYYMHNFKKAWSMAAGEEGGERYDMLVLDEVITASNLGFLDEQALLEALENRPPSMEVILTGRNPSKALCARSDYLTEMKLHRHPYIKGVSAREGIEF